MRKHMILSSRQNKYFEKQFRKNSHIPELLANKRFFCPVLAKDAQQYVYDEIEKNYDQIIQAYDVNSNFKRYFTIVVQQFLTIFTESYINTYKDFIFSLAQQNFNDYLANQVCEYVLDQLKKNDCQLIRCYKGDTNFEDYLSNISNHCFIEFPGYKVSIHATIIDEPAQQLFNPKKTASGENTAHEAFLYVLEGLAKNKWQRIRAYNGKIPFDIYLKKWARYLLIDFYRLNIDPGIMPKHLKDNEDQRLVYNFLCMQRLSETDIIEQLDLLGYPQTKIERLIKKISKDYPDCFKLRKKDIYIEQFIDEDITKNLETNPENDMIKTESETMMTDLAQLFVSVLTDSFSENDLYIYDKDIVTIRKKLMQEFMPDARQREFLEMIYLYDISIKDAAEKLNWSKRTAYRQKKQLISQIRTIIGEQAIEKIFN